MTKSEELLARLERGRHRFAGWVRRWSRRTWMTVLAAIALLVVARVAAPYVIEWQVNRKLAELPDYRGSVSDVDLSLLGSAIAFDGLRLDKRRGDPEMPFLRVAKISVDFQWRPLLDGKIVSDLEIDRPVLNLMPEATSKREPKKQVEKEEEGDAVSRAADTLIPTRIRHLRVHRGSVRFRDGTSKPPVDLRLHRIELTVRGLSTEAAPDHRLPTRGRASARLQDSGKVRARIRLNVFAEHPTFDLDLSVRGLDVRELRDFTRAYADVDIEKGRFSVFTELAARDGRVKGYAKPMLRDIDVLDTDGGDENDGFFQKAWEGAVGGVSWILEDGDSERVATRIPIQGKLDKPGIDIWATVGNLITNAFIEALLPKLDRSISFSDILG